MIRVIADDGNFWPGFMDGKWWNTQLIQFASTRGIKVTRMNGNDSYIEFPDAELLPMSAFLGSAPDGFTIYNWPCFLSLDATKYNDQVPEGIPDRIIVNEDETETVKTWAQWGSTSHVDLTDGTKGIPLVYNSTACTNVECAALFGLTGYTLLNEVDYRALKPVVNSGT